MVKKYTQRKKRKIDQNMPKGELKRIDDLLPPLSELLEIVDEMNDPKLLKTIVGGRRAIRRGVRGISLSESIGKRKKISF